MRLNIYNIFDTGKSLKPGICSDLNNTLTSYRRSSTKTYFEWTYKFKDPEVAFFCETFVKYLLSQFREKKNSNSEIFDLDLYRMKKIILFVIGIFDDPESTRLEKIDKFIDLNENILKIILVVNVKLYLEI